MVEAGNLKAQKSSARRTAGETSRADCRDSTLKILGQGIRGARDKQIKMRNPAIAVISQKALDTACRALLSSPLPSAVESALIKLFDSPKSATAIHAIKPLNINQTLNR